MKFQKAIILLVCALLCGACGGGGGGSASQPGNQAQPGETVINGKA